MRLAILILAALPLMAAWPNGYTYRASVVIDHTKVPSTQTDFVVAVFGTFANLTGKIVDTTNCHDFIFTSDANGSSVLPFERVVCSESTGAVEFHVKVASVSHTVDTTIYAFYGKSGESDQSTTSTWPSSYAGVWHLKPGTGTPDYTDSTANANTGTRNGIAEITAVTAKVDGGIEMNGTDHGINLGTPASLTLTSQVTMQAWVKWTGTVDDGTYQYVVGKGYDGTNQPYYLEADGQFNNTMRCGVYPGAEIAWALTNFSTGTWYHLVCAYDGANIKLYVDGVERATAANTGSFGAGTARVTIGMHDVAGALARFFPGSLDEVSIQNTGRTADWVAATYNNQVDFSTFADVTWDETSGGAPPAAVRRKILQ
jgi:hypothetical protein